MTSKAENPWRTEKVYRTRREVQPWVWRIRAALEGAGTTVHVAGSWRRGAPLVGDLDVIVVTADGRLPADLVERTEDFIRIDTGGVDCALAHCSIVLPDGELHVDFYGATPDQEGPFLWHLTGPKNLNIVMRAEAIRKGWMLSQHGLFDMANAVEEDGKVVDMPRLDDGTEDHIGRLLGFERALMPPVREQWAEPRPEVARQRTVKSSNGVTEYVVTLAGDKASCTCPGYTYRRKCRHVKEALS